MKRTVTRRYAETGILALDLVNTYDGYLSEPERVPDSASLKKFLEETGAPGEPGRNDLAAFRALRDRLRHALEADSNDETLEQLTAIAHELRAMPSFEATSPGRWRLTIQPVPDAPLAERLSVLAINDLAALIAEHGLARIRCCAAPPCRDAFVDTSRNGSRRYCSERCANRLNATRHRSRA